MSDKRFSEELKSATWPIHQQVDKKVFTLLKDSQKDLVPAFAQWYNRLISAGILTCDLDASLLDIDFQYLTSLLPPQKDHIEKAVTMTSQHQCLGAYYVIRGSANGSRFIIKNLPQQHKLYPYFQYLASLTDTHWLHLKKRLDQVEMKNQSSVIEGATLAFSWLLDEVQKIPTLERKTQ